MNKIIIASCLLGISALISGCTSLTELLTPPPLISNFQVIQFGDQIYMNINVSPAATYRIIVSGWIRLPEEASTIKHQITFNEVTNGGENGIYTYQILSIDGMTFTNSQILPLDTLFSYNIYVKGSYESDDTTQTYYTQVTSDTWQYINGTLSESSVNRIIKSNK